MAQTNYLQEILKVLHRMPCSQSDLCEKFNLSKSHVHNLVSNLITPGLIQRSEQSEYKQDFGRPKQTLSITPALPYSSVLIIHTSWMSRAYLYAYGYTEEIAFIDLEKTNNVDDFIKTINTAIDEFKKLYLQNSNGIKSVVVATQATIEQGPSGMMYRNNNLKETNIPLASLLTSGLNIKTYVYNYAYGHMLSLLHAPYLDTDNAMALSCGEGSVALGLFINGKIVLGRNNSFPECSHLPFKYGFEKSLGTYNRYTHDALLYAIESIAPIYNLNHIIVAGSCFDDHLETIYKVGQELKYHKDPIFHNMSIEYRGLDIEKHQLELIYLSFDALVDELNLKIQKRDLADFVKELESPKY